MTNKTCSIFLAAVLATMTGVAMNAEPASAQSRSAYCDSYARDVAGGRSGSRAGDVLTGTIGGALGGAAIGGVIDGGEGAGKGAVIGGVAGTALGLAGSGSNRAYRRAYNDCMENGNYRRSGVRAGSDGWIAYCSAKYRSFNPRTGTYTTYDGRQVRCR